MIQGNAYRRCSRKARQQGQTLVEYAVAVTLILGMFFIINRSILDGIGRLWKTMSKEIAAGCPTCEPSAEIR